MSENYRMKQTMQRRFVTAAVVGLSVAAAGCGSIGEQEHRLQECPQGAFARGSTRPYRAAASGRYALPGRAGRALRPSPPYLIARQACHYRHRRDPG